MSRKIFYNHLLFPNDDKKGHFKALDGLRGIAVLLVLLSHSSLDKLYLFSVLNFENTGKVGVFLFFVLSAYLLDRQIIIGFVTNQANYRFWLNYFLRRFLRIYPLYAIALFVFFLASGFSATSPIKSLHDVGEHLLLLKGEGIFWSIVVEFKYYFLSPLIMAFCNYTLKWRFEYVSFFIASLIAFFIYYEAAHDLDEASVFRYMPIFLTGTFLSIYEIVYLQKDKAARKSSALEMSGFVAVLLIISTIPSVFKHIFNTTIKSWYFHNPLFYFPYALLWSIILLAAKYGSFEVFKRFFELKVLRFLGVVSFSLYLFHIPVLKLVELSKLHIPKEIQVYIFLLAASGISFLSYILIERHLQQIRISYKEAGNNISPGKKNFRTLIISKKEKSNITE